MSLVPRGALYAAFLLSGLTALIYQIIWSRYLMLLVGGTSVAHTIVLATFMGGLAFGNAYFGRRADRPGTDRLRLYALLELGIGVACMLFPPFFESLSRVYLSLAAVSGPGAAVNNVFKVLLAALSMFVPCVLMGGTLPVLAKYIVDSMAGFGVRLGFLYFINTAGAVVGCILGGFYVIEAWGLEAGMVAAAIVNLAIGGVFYLWSKRLRAPAPALQAGAAPAAGPEAAGLEAAALEIAAAEAATPEPAPEIGYSALQARAAFWGIGVAGAISMLYELAWTRVLTLSMGGTVHSFSTMLVSFISGIAIGSALAGRLMRRARNALVLFGLCEIGIALSILLPLRAYERLPFAFHRIGSWLSHTPETYGMYLFVQVLLAAVIMLVPTTLIGAALPLATRVYVDRLDVLGRRVGSVFSINTVGTVLGAVLTGFVLLPWLGVERTLLAGSMVSGLIGIALLWAWRPRAQGSPVRALAEGFRPRPPAAGPALWPTAAGLVGIAALAALLSPRWDARVMQQALYRWGGHTFRTWEEFRATTRQGSFLYIRDGADGTIAVQERNPANRVIRVNGKPDASTIGDMPTQLMVGHLPMLLHPQPRTAMVVGLGSGATVSAVLRHPGVVADVAEISPEMVEAARYFDAWTGRVLDHPGLRLHVADAREFLLLTNQRYDVIVSEPTNVWIPGVANLFTREFYQVARSRLQPGGLFAQWIHSYSSGTELVGPVIATLRSEFPYVSAWLVEEGDLILLAGERRPRLDAAQFAQRLAALEPSFHVPQERPRRLVLFSDPIIFLAHQLGSSEGVSLAWPPGTAATLHDLRPRLEFQAARAQYLGVSYPMREFIDGRLTRLGSEPLFLEEYLAQRPLDAPARQALAGNLGELGGAFRDLRASVAAGLVRSSGRDDPMTLLGLSDSLLATMTLSDRLAASIDAGDRSLPVCEAYLIAEHKVLREGSSIFARLPVDRLDARMAPCLSAHPAEAASFRVQVAQAAADAGASQAALQRIRQLEQDGTLARIDNRKASQLLVSGAIILMGSGAYDEAMPWAVRAHDLNGANVAATRILRALHGRQLAAQRRTASAGS